MNNLRGQKKTFLCKYTVHTKTKGLYLRNPIHINVISISNLKYFLTSNKFTMAKKNGSKLQNAVTEAEIAKL